MAVFSGNRAVGAGFRLIGREPLAFLAWTLAYVVLAILPQAWMFHTILTQMPALGDAQPTMQEMIELQSRMLVIQPVSLLSSLLSYVVINGAVFRAVLQPDDRRFLYLRLGAQELWLGLVAVVIVVLFVIVMLVMFIPIGIIVGIAAASAGEAAAGLVTLVVMLLGAALVTWLALRVLLALPMSFDQRNFRLPEALRLSRGHVGKMFLVFLALMLIALAAQMLLFAISVGAVVAGVGPGGFDDADPTALLQGIGPGVWIAIGVVWALYMTGYSTLLSAALASIYKDLRDTSADG